MDWKRAKDVRPGDVVGGVTVTAVDILDGWVEIVFDNGRTGVYRPLSQLLVSCTN